MATMIQPDDTTHDVIAGIDHFLALIAAVRAEKPRDPLRRLEDVLLEMRTGVKAGAQ